MLSEIEAIGAEQLATLGSVVKRFTFERFCQSAAKQGHNAQILVDNPTQPAVVAAHHGIDFMIFGQAEAFEAALADLLHGRVEQTESWPDPGVAGDWQRWGGTRGLFLNSCSTLIWEAALRAGFSASPDTDPQDYADSFYFEGSARFGDQIVHRCRLGEGLELKSLLMQGVGYDPEGHYVERCLQYGPSFVCEVDGQAVSWSCTHLNGTMGMIYTPSEHRRKGYARSLTAFQTDYMLARDGFACCHVVHTNTPSQALLSGLGGIKIEDRVCWRVVYWPDGL